MILKSLEMQGFKSFPDKIKVEFGKGITAIVGPNGSGKSNISDALRWVLGEMSGKTLRSSKMEDVIFTGTSQRKAQGFAEVNLTIDNSDRELDTDFNEVTVTRRYYRSGESEYFINKTPSRLKDIHELFMDTGLGRDGYSIIGQGKIAEILSPKSEDRRQIIEEVAGISKYRYRKNEAQRKLAATEENLIRLSDIIAELSERLPALESQSRKASKYLLFYGEKKRLEVSLWVAELDQIKDNANKMDEAFQLAKSQLDDISVEIDNLELEITQIFENNKNINVQIEQIRAKENEIEQLSTDLKSRLAVLDTSIQFEIKGIERLDSELTEHNMRVGELEIEIEKFTLILEQKKQEIEQNEQKLNDFYAQIEHINSKSEDIKTEMSRYRDVISSLDENKNALHIKMIATKTAIDSKNIRLQESDGAISQQILAINTINSEIDSLKASFEQETERLESERNAVNGIEKMLDIKSKKYDNAAQNAEKLQDEIKTISQRCRILRDMEKHLEGFTGSVKFVLENSRRGTLRGIVGTISQIIKVDDAHIIAIETALGAAIQNIVTDTQASAKNAMMMLKNNSIGRATFLPMDNLTPKIINSSSIKGNYIGMAHELVKNDAKYDKAVEFLLGRTIVCESIEQAIILARRNSNRFKIVTLDGQIINSGGSMTGGSTAKSAGLLTRNSQIKQLEQKLEQKETEFSDANVIFQKALSEKAQLQAKYDGLTASIRVHEQELLKISDLIGNKMVVFNSYTKLKEDYQAERAAIEKSIEHDEGMVGELELEMQAINIEIEKQQQMLTNLSGTGEKDAMEIEKIRRMIADCDVTKMSVFKDMESTMSAIEQLKQQRHHLESDFERRREQITAAKSTIEKAHIEKNAAVTEIDRLNLLQTEGREQIVRLIEARRQNETLQSKYRSEQKEKSAVKERLLQETARLENKLSSVCEKSDRIIEQLLEYELTVSEAKAQADPIETLTAARTRVSELKSQIKALGNINVESIEEYKIVKERFDFLDEQANDLKCSKEELEKIIKELLWRMTKIFSEQFIKLNEEFGKVFAELFEGGRAELLLSDPDDVLNCDIEIRVAPPGKIIKNIISLSGGEQAFSAIALYFAILKVKPTPFCMFDEIEAALDDVNVLRFASRLRNYSNNTQFIVITHRRGTMEEADVLYGVTMQEKGISKLLTINVNEIERQIK